MSWFSDYAETFVDRWTDKDEQKEEHAMEKKGDGRTFVTTVAASTFCNKVVVPSNIKGP